MATTYLLFIIIKRIINDLHVLCRHFYNFLDTNENIIHTHILYWFSTRHPIIH